PKNMPTRPPTPAEFRIACGQFATGVSVLTVERAPGKVHGMTANSLTSVSLNPLLLLICVDHRAQFLPMVQEKKRFGVNILKDDQLHCLTNVAKREEKPAIRAQWGIRYRWTDPGIPLSEDAPVHFGCNVVSSHVPGDHPIFIGEVETAEVFDGEPLLYFRGGY